MGIPPAKETFFHVAMRTCFGWNVSVPTIASLQIKNVWSSVGENMIAERESFKIRPQVPARPRTFRPREKNVESSRPNQPDICFQPLSDLNAFFILSRVQVTLQSGRVIIQLEVQYVLRLYIPITELNRVMVVSS